MFIIWFSFVKHHLVREAHNEAVSRCGGCRCCGDVTSVLHSHRDWVMKVWENQQEKKLIFTSV